MENVADLMGALFNASLTIMIVATMFAAGLATTTKALGSVFKNIWLLVLVLVTAFVLRPLVGWGLAAVFSLGTASYIVMLLLAACPGAPLGAKFVMTAKGDLTTAASLQVVLAAIGSITFPLVANFMITGAGLGEDFSLPVAELIRTVAILQLLPFVVGICRAALDARQRHEVETTDPANRQLYAVDRHRAGPAGQLAHDPGPVR